ATYRARHQAFLASVRNSEPMERPASVAAAATVSRLRLRANGVAQSPASPTSARSCRPSRLRWRSGGGFCRGGGRSAGAPGPWTAGRAASVSADWAAGASQGGSFGGPGGDFVAAQGQDAVCGFGGVDSEVDGSGDG